MSKSSSAVLLAAIGVIAIGALRQIPRASDRGDVLAAMQRQINPATLSPR